MLFHSGPGKRAKKEAVQTVMSEFPVDAKYAEIWEYGLELLGRPLTARLTSYPNSQYLDIYFQ